MCSVSENSGVPSNRDEAVDLVWDSGRAGTGYTGRSAPIAVGGEPGWSPGDLLCLAAEADLLVSFLKMAPEGEILGYVSAAGPESGDPPGSMRIIIRPCIVIESKERSDAVLEMLHRALEASPVCRVLGGLVVLDPSIVVESRPVDT